VILWFERLTNSTKQSNTNPPVDTADRRRDRGALLIIPIILAYTVWSYYVFRGKVKHGQGYH
jgi:hypothetical protein